MDNTRPINGKNQVHPLRNILFLMGYAITTGIHSVNSILFAVWMPVRHRQRFVNLWCRFNLWWLEKTCGISSAVSGLENIPDQPCVVAAKHQSTWETFYLQTIFSPQATVLKKELLFIPFFGWGLAILQPIVIDRKKKQNALKQVIQQGKMRLEQGRWVVIYPEGTRKMPGEKIELNAGAAMLASKAGVPVVPVALNAGECWPARGKAKYSGHIDVVIGEPISSENKSVKELNQEIQAWIQQKMLEISELERGGAALSTPPDPDTVSHEAIRNPSS